MSFLAWLILLVLLTAAAPAVGVLLGLAFAAVFFPSDDDWHGLRRRAVDALRRVRGVSAAVDAAFGRAVGRLGGTPRTDLPARLLRQRLRPFRVEATDEHGQRRVYEVNAKHLGAAQMKARAWGTNPRRIVELP